MPSPIDENCAQWGVLHRDARAGAVEHLGAALNSRKWHLLREDRQHPFRADRLCTVGQPLGACHHGRFVVADHEGEQFVTADPGRGVGVDGSGVDPVGMIPTAVKPAALADETRSAVG